MNGVYRAEMADSTAALPAGAGEKAQGSLAAAQQIGEQLGPQGHELVVHAQTAFLHGFTHGLIGGAALLLLRRSVRRRPGTGARRVPLERHREAGRRRRGRGRLTSTEAQGRLRRVPAAGALRGDANVVCKVS